MFGALELSFCSDRQWDDHFVEALPQFHSVMHLFPPQKASQSLEELGPELVSWLSFKASNDA